MNDNLLLLTRGCPLARRRAARPDGP